MNLCEKCANKGNSGCPYSWVVAGKGFRTGSGSPRESCPSFRPFSWRDEGDK
jgi:hypothetical protein